MPDKFEYILATDLDRAWLNFELDLPLEPGLGGAPNPFYVDRPDNPVAALEEALRLPFLTPPKIFFSGLRGCGKSTELYRIAVNPDITRLYWPVHFSIRHGPGVDNLDYRDVLLEIGGQMYRQYRERGGKLSGDLVKELDAFRGHVEKEVIITPGRMAGTEVDAKLNAFFAEAGVKIKLEPQTRAIVRQVIEQNIRGLIDLLNLIAYEILQAEHRWPLVLIDDLDKPDLGRSREIFYDHRETMTQPNVPIVYTIASPLFYQPEVRDLLGIPIFLPNVKLHERGQTELISDGYHTLRMFIRKRMEPALIADDALDAATRISGGVFRELCRVMRSAIGYAKQARRPQPRIEPDDVRKAEAEIRAYYWRFLSQDDRRILRGIRRYNQYNMPDKVAPLLQSLAAVEYANGEPWCDVHPVLIKLLDETAEYDSIVAAAQA